MGRNFSFFFFKDFFEDPPPSWSNSISTLHFMMTEGLPISHEKNFGVGQIINEFAGKPETQFFFTWPYLRPARE